MKNVALVKTVSWVLVGLLLSILVSYLYYGSFMLTGFLILLAAVVNTAYYVHEKAWNKVTRRNDRNKWKS